MTLKNARVYVLIITGFLILPRGPVFGIEGPSQDDASFSYRPTEKRLKKILRTLKKDFVIPLEKGQSNAALYARFQEFRDAVEIEGEMFEELKYRSGTPAKDEAHAKEACSLLLYDVAYGLDEANRLFAAGGYSENTLHQTTQIPAE